MTPTETVHLAKYISALCPQQAMNEHTADAWHDVLGGYDLAECRAATVAVASRQPFVAPSEIIAEIRRARRVKADRDRTAAVLAPARERRERLDDPRPLRETIRAILTRHGRPELAP